MNITVYLGASESRDETITAAVIRLGQWIAHEGHTLVYGGSKNGLMGCLAKAVLTCGGQVIGVEPRSFVESDMHFCGLSRLEVVEDIPARKTRMIELGDVFIAFPGGTGTLEEIAEVMSLSAMGWLSKPYILYDINGYYRHLRSLLKQMTEKGFSSAERQRGIHFAPDLETIRAIINEINK